MPNQIKTQKRIRARTNAMGKALGIKPSELRVPSAFADTGADVEETFQGTVKETRAGVRKNGLAPYKGWVLPEYHTKYGL